MNIVVWCMFEHACVHRQWLALEYAIIAIERSCKDNSNRQYKAVKT